MHIITAPQHYHPRNYGKSIFLAGGITGCPDWQSEAIQILETHRFVGDVFNPRRPEFPMDDSNSAQQQIEWEFDYLNSARAIMFWFPKETACPITLYELGFWLSHYAHANMRYSKIITIGCHPEYSRLQDLKIQSSLVSGGFKIYNNLADVTLATLKKLSPKN